MKGSALCPDSNYNSKKWQKADIAWLWRQKMFKYIDDNIVFLKGKFWYLFFKRTIKYKFDIYNKNKKVKKIGKKPKNTAKNLEIVYIRVYNRYVCKFFDNEKL